MTIGRIVDRFVSYEREELRASHRVRAITRRKCSRPFLFSSSLARQFLTSDSSHRRCRTLMRTREIHSSAPQPTRTESVSAGLDEEMMVEILVG